MQILNIALISLYFLQIRIMYSHHYTMWNRHRSYFHWMIGCSYIPVSVTSFWNKVIFYTQFLSASTIYIFLNIYRISNVALIEKSSDDVFTLLYTILYEWFVHCVKYTEHQWYSVISFGIVLTLSCSLRNKMGLFVIFYFHQ